MTISNQMFMNPIIFPVKPSFYTCQRISIIQIIFFDNNETKLGISNIYIFFKKNLSLGKILEAFLNNTWVRCDIVT